MPIALMWFLILLLGLASLLFNSAAWLWMAAKWCRIPGVSYRRALAAMSLLTVVSIMLQSAILFLNQQTGTVLAILGLYAIATIICIKQVLRTTTRRAMAAGLISTFISSLSALPVVIPFKMFVIESFVVPSGSMALAVIGTHFDVVCDRCGRKFPVSATTRFANQQRARGLGQMAGGIFADRSDNRQQVCRCPNCGVERTIAADVATAAGDKILADKLGVPRRWDLVIFRYPENLSTNYLKRLIGLPGETVEIIAGDIFINDRREAKPFGVGHDLWILVNDTRLRAVDLAANDPQWKADTTGSNWKWDQPGWTFSGANLDSQELVFSGQTTDESFFAERWADETLSADERPLESGDLQVRCLLARYAGDGPLGFRWTFRGHEATASVTGDGRIELRTDQDSQQAHLENPLSKTRSIAFAVRDGIAMLIADGEPLATLAVGPQDAASCREIREDASKPCRIAITAGHCDLELTQIVLERDVYYRSFDGLECHGCIGKPITLGPQEHFVLGDHSIRANDSRLWQDIDAGLQGRFQVGTVPGELMIGVARCIYWPPDRWHALR